MKRTGVQDRCGGRVGSVKARGRVDKQVEREVVEVTAMGCFKMEE